MQPPNLPMSSLPSATLPTAEPKDARVAEIMASLAPPLPPPNPAAKYLPAQEMEKGDWAYFCEPCDRGFYNERRYLEHCEEHIYCPVPGCNFVCRKEYKLEIHHALLHNRPGSANLEDTAKYLEERRKRYPTRERVKEKLRLEELKKQRGQDNEGGVHTKGNKSGKGKGGKGGKGKKDHRDLPRPPLYYLCRKCGRSGHYTEHCWYDSSDNTKGNKRHRQRSSSSERPVEVSAKKPRGEEEPDVGDKGNQPGGAEEDKGKAAAEAEGEGGAKAEEQQQQQGGWKWRPRKKKRSLYDKLVESDVVRERSLLLQCMRYFVTTNFLEEEVDWVAFVAKKSREEIVPDVEASPIAVRPVVGAPGRGNAEAEEASGAKAAEELLRQRRAPGGGLRVDPPMKATKRVRERKDDDTLGESDGSWDEEAIEAALRASVDNAAPQPLKRHQADLEKRGEEATCNQGGAPDDDINGQMDSKSAEEEKESQEREKREKERRGEEERKEEKEREGQEKGEKAKEERERQEKEEKEKEEREKEERERQEEEEKAKEERERQEKEEMEKEERKRKEKEEGEQREREEKEKQRQEQERREKEEQAEEKKKEELERERREKEEAERVERERREEEEWEMRNEKESEEQGKRGGIEREEARERRGVERREKEERKERELAQKAREDDEARKAQEREAEHLGKEKGVPAVGLEANQGKEAGDDDINAVAMALKDELMAAKQHIALLERRLQSLSSKTEGA